MAWFIVSPGATRRDDFRSGQAGCGLAGPGMARQATARLGEAWCGEVWRGAVWPGRARRGVYIVASGATSRDESVRACEAEHFFEGESK